jgi:hypothetical protein
MSGASFHQTIGVTEPTATQGPALERCGWLCRSESAVGSVDDCSYYYLTSGQPRNKGEKRLSLTYLLSDHVGRSAFARLA